MSTSGSPSKGRGKRQSPARGLPRFSITARDVEVVKSVGLYGLLDTHQIEARLFRSESHPNRRTKTSECIQRLGLLYRHGYLARMERPHLMSEGRKPYVYGVTERGARLVADALDCDLRELDWRRPDRQVSPPFLDHLLASNTIRLQMELSAERNGYTLLRWIDERTLRRSHGKDKVLLTAPDGTVQETTVIPDGAFHLETPYGRGHFFIECDRATVTGIATRFQQRDWVKRILAYNEYHRSGFFQARYGATKFRMLTVTTSMRRLETLKSATESAGGKNRYWLATFEDIERFDPLTDAIWSIAGRTGSYALVDPYRV